MADTFITKINAGGTPYTIQDPNAKTKQTAKTDPTAGNTPTNAFIATITQNANGEITATKQNVGNLNASVITDGTLGVAHGGTGASSFTANSVVISNTSTTGALTTSAITTSELGYLSGATGNIQQQIDAISGGQSGGVDHIRFFKNYEVNANQSLYAGVGTVSGGTRTWSGIVDGKTLSVGDIIIGKNYGMGSVTQIQESDGMLNITATYLGIFTATISYANAYDSGSKTLTLPTSAALLFTKATGT